MAEGQARHNGSNKGSDAKEKQASKQYIHPALNRTRKAKAINRLKNRKTLL